MLKRSRIASSSKQYVLMEMSTICPDSMVKREDLWKELVGKVIVVTEVIPIYTLSFAARNKENKTDDDFYTQYCPVFTFVENVQNPEDYPAILKMKEHLDRQVATQTE